MPSTKTFAFRLTPDGEAQLQQVIKAYTGKDVFDTESMRLLIDNLSQKLIIDKDKPTETVIQKPEPLENDLLDCHFRAYDPKKEQWYCDIKKVNFYACVNRQKRLLLNSLKCFPAHYGKNYIAEKTHPKKIFDKNFRCTLRDRLVPITYLPLTDCQTCPNTFCKEEIDNLLKSI